MINSSQLTKMASALRILSADMVQKANSGHPGMPLGMSDVMAVLYNYFIKFNPKDPTWINRDRFVLSAGHGSALLYATLHLTGYEKISLEDLKNFRQIDSITAGHPEIFHEAGIEVTTGPLGHGVSMAVGLSIASKKSAELFPELINNKTYVIAGDGCLMEGISYEALALAGTLNLNNLIVIWDNNNITIDGEVSITSIENQKQRFEANGFLVIEINGHSYEEIYNALLKAQTSTQPVLISAKTQIAKYSPTKEGKSSSHGSPLGEEEIKGLRNNLNWHYLPFEIPCEVKEAWQNTYNRVTKEYNEWKNSYTNYSKKQEVDNFFNKNYFSHTIEKNICDFANSIIEKKPNKATRLSSLDVLEVLVKDIPNLIGGSADLTGSVMTKTTHSTVLNKNNYLGNYINYGIREHAMGAILNGLAAYGGFVPYGGTFLVFSDFLRPAIRLSALQELQSIFILTHDSIGLGEDGPTHQPIEHLASLRLIPHLDVFRPCDGIESLETWLLAVSNTKNPTALIFSRQNIPTLRTTYSYGKNLTSLGGYVLSMNQNNNLITINGDTSIIPKEQSFEVNLIASGTEVSLAQEVSMVLGNKGINSKVISMPSLGRFKKNTKEYIKQVIGLPKLNVIIEAATINGYDGLFNNSEVLEFGINTFGKSGKASEIYKHFGLTVDNIVSKIMEKV